MNLVRNPAKRLGRRQPPLIRQYWLHHALRQRHGDDDAQGAGNKESEPTQSGEAALDNQA